MKHVLLSAIALFSLQFATAQTVFSTQKNIDWSIGQVVSPGGRAIEVPNFEGAFFTGETPLLPSFSANFPVNGFGKLTVEMTDANWAFFEKKPTSDDVSISEKIDFKTFVAEANGNWFGSLRFVPIRRAGAGFERLVSFGLRVNFVAEPLPFSPRGGFATTSVLADGEIYKFGVNQSGVYKLTADFLSNTLKISNLGSIDPRQIKLFGNGGGMLPEANAATRTDDLVENAIIVSGQEDGKFDGSDFILFYAPGPDRWTFNESAATVQFNVATNIYDDNAHYFLKISPGNGLRIAERESLAATTYATSEGDDFKWFEEEKFNALDYSSTAQGSGRRWFGDKFINDRDADYSSKFDFKNVVATAPGRAKMLFAGRGGGAQTVKFSVGDKVFSGTISQVNVSNNEDSFANDRLVEGSFAAADGFNVGVDYPATSFESEGFLDYIAVQVRRNLVQTGNQMEFRDQKTKAQLTSKFSLSATGSFSIWDITNPTAPVSQKLDANTSGINFGAETGGQLRNFISFNSTDGFLSPQISEGKIANQNLHNLDGLDLAIVFHPDFEAAATALADHRKSFSSYSVANVSVKQIFNEFSSGAQDPTAIRDFARMLYERNPLKFRYLCLFGDGSVDYKNIRGDVAPSGFVPVWETPNSFNPIHAYPSDDFFAMLDPQEGATITSGLLDIGVGRITVRTADEADAIVQKIKDYDQSPATLGHWRESLMFVADDEDSNQHINQADTLANQLEKNYPIFNPEKIYLDAYQQVSTAGDPQFPDAKLAINAAVFKGGLTMQWIGHGGPKGWAQERVISNFDIENWDNPNKYPLLITATCSFGGYDDPTLTTGGEQVFLKKNSGAIGLFTTVRAVYIQPNNELTSALADTIFGKNGANNQAIGLILTRAKNALGTDENSRRFTLIGDPSMQLAVPKMQVFTTEINGNSVVSGKPDTIKSLQPVTLKGDIRDVSGQTLTGFNGTLSVIIFDKISKVKTLGNDPTSYIRTFNVRRNVIFKGKATVANGKWTVNFIVPKDINYEFGYAKISYYAENGTPIDAGGAFKGLVIGGTFGNAIVEDQPPKVDVFMNNEDFAFGGLTDAEPKIFARISDDHGINVTGAGIGHDLTAIIDGKTANALILNDFYESAVDNPAKGKAIYPLSKLEVGRHTVRIKAWDIANNSGEGETEFIVAESAEGALAHVLNYPNPFTTTTRFQFEHNLAGEALHVQVQIFSVAGKLVKTLESDLSPEGYRVSDLAWDGLDDYGDQLARGVYLYKIRLETAASGQKRKAESKFERLVILK